VSRYVLQHQSGHYVAAPGQSLPRPYVRELEKAERFAHYVDAFNARAVGERVIEL
jgi:hypothetical protein